MNSEADPFTELAAGAIQAHELFMAFVEAGFSEAQALDLVKVMLMKAVS
jgi:hypothetical protein